jgi:hypothetical protein
MPVVHGLDGPIAQIVLRQRHCGLRVTYTFLPRFGIERGCLHTLGGRLKSEAR